MKLRKIVLFVLALSMVLAMSMTGAMAVVVTTKEALVAAVEAGGEITVNTEIDLEDDVLYLKGKNVTVNGTGTIKGNNDIFAIYHDNRKPHGNTADTTLTLGSGLNLISQTGNCVYLQTGKVITSANMTSYSTRYGVIQNNGDYAGDVTINGGTIEAKGRDQYRDDGTKQGAIYWPGNGKLTINGGTIIGGTAVYVKSGQLTINGGTLKGTGVRGEYDPNNSNGCENTGDALIIEHSMDSSYENPAVTVNGGTFESDDKYGIESVAGGTSERLTGFIKTAKLDPWLSHLDLVAPGSAIVSDGKNRIDYIAPTLQEALDAAIADGVTSVDIYRAEDDETASINANLIVNNYIGKDITINGVSLTNGETHSFTKTTYSAPRTGDNTPILLLCALMMLSACGFAASKRRSA